MKTKKEYNQEYYAENQERERARALEYYHRKKRELTPEQREAKAEYMRRWTQEHKEEIKAYRQARKDQRNARRRELYAQDEQRRIDARAKAQEWQQNNPVKRKAQRLKEYQITTEEFTDLLKRQNYKCAICGYSDMSDPNFFPLVDHCHETGKVRGLLCMNCNQALGKFKDSPERLRAALAYLENVRPSRITDA